MGGGGGGGGGVWQMLTSSGGGGGGRSMLTVADRWRGGGVKFAKILLTSYVNASLTDFLKKSGYKKLFYPFFNAAPPPPPPPPE